MFNVIHIWPKDPKISINNKDLFAFNCTIYIRLVNKTFVKCYFCLKIVKYSMFNNIKEIVVHTDNRLRIPLTFKV